MCCRAADEYILRYFNKYLESFSDTSGMSLLRVVDVDRKVQSVPREVQKYCLISNISKSFTAPTRDDIKKHNIVVTTLVTSLVLTELCIKGSFTHIFVDEAAQVNLPSSHVLLFAEIVLIYT
jgi:hypothetical protein